MTPYIVTTVFLVYADDKNHAEDQVSAILDGVEGLNDRYEILDVCKSIGTDKMFSLRMHFDQKNITGNDIIDLLEYVITDLRDMKFDGAQKFDGGNIIDFDGKDIGEWRVR